MYVYCNPSGNHGKYTKRYGKKKKKKEKENKTKHLFKVEFKKRRKQERKRKLENYWKGNTKMVNLNLNTSH